MKDHEKAWMDFLYYLKSLNISEDERVNIATLSLKHAKLLGEAKQLDDSTVHDHLIPELSSSTPQVTNFLGWQNKHNHGVPDGICDMTIFTNEGRRKGIWWPESELMKRPEMAGLGTIEGFLGQLECQDGLKFLCWTNNAEFVYYVVDTEGFATKSSPKVWLKHITGNQAQDIFRTVLAWRREKITQQQCIDMIRQYSRYPQRDLHLLLVELAQMSIDDLRNEINRLMQ